MGFRRTSIKQHAAGGLVVTGTLSLETASIKAVQANSTFAGQVTMALSATTVVISVSTVKSNSILMIRPETANAADMILGYSVNPASTVDGKSFMVLASAAVTVATPINYMVVSTI